MAATAATAAAATATYRAIDLPPVDAGASRRCLMMSRMSSSSSSTGAGSGSYSPSPAKYMDRWGREAMTLPFW